MDTLTLTVAMLLSLTVGLAGARGALGIVLYLLEAGDGMPNRTATAPIVSAPAAAANPPTHS